MKKIVIVEDDESIRKLLQMTLSNFQYDSVDFENGLDAKAYLENHPADLLIADLMVPGMDGYSLITWVRSQKALQDLPILVLSAKDKELDKVTGLDMGADDYMTKPFSILELAARIRSLLRRAQKSSSVLEADGLVMDLDSRNVSVDGQEVDLTYKEFELLKYLLQNANRAVEREELLSKIWGYDFIGESRTLDVHINSLRKKIGPVYAKKIQSVRQVGYRFNTAKSGA